MFDAVRNSTVKLEMKGIDKALQGHQMQKGKYPKNLSTFLLQNQGGRSLRKADCDPWGKSYLYKLVGDGYEVLSLGPDELIDTGDEILLQRSGDKLAVTSGRFSLEVSLVAALEDEVETQINPRIATVLGYLKLEDVMPPPYDQPLALIRVMMESMEMAKQ